MTALSGGVPPALRGFFVTWWRLWQMQTTRPFWRRAYWTTVVWNRMGRGRDFVS